MVTFSANVFIFKAVAKQNKLGLPHDRECERARSCLCGSDAIENHACAG